jgi:NAD(P)-dependent dehydrogenase (short-subunit alcohol dehydrogenase family)
VHWARGDGRKAKVDMAVKSLEGKVVVVTGASSGFGKGASRRLAQEGASLVLAARRGALLDELRSECEALGVRALAVPTDVSMAADVRALAEAAVAAFGRIDVWVNDAGVGAIGYFERIPLEDHEQVIRTNLLGTLYGSYCAYTQFLRQGSGTLINIASELGGHSVPYYAAYVASKHGVVGLSDSLRQEIAAAKADGIHVCTIMPTAHDTPFFDHAANYTGHEVVAPPPLHDPENVVETIVSLARDPKDRKIVGADGVFKILMKKLAPKVQDAVDQKFAHREQIEKAPPGADSSNALHEPVGVGTEVEAGRRKK